MKQDRERERKLCCFMMKSNNNFFYHDATAPTGPRTFSLSRIHDHTQRRTTVGRTPMDEWSAVHRDLYLTTHNTYKRQASMPPVGFEPTIPGSERPQTHGLGRAATGIDLLITDPIVCCRWRKDELINEWIISNGGMILTRQNRSSGVITCPSATLSTTYLKRTGLESNPVHRTVNHFKTRSV